MPKDPSFDYYLDQQIEEHMRDEPHDEYCEEQGCAECEEEEEGLMPACVREAHIERMVKELSERAKRNGEEEE